MAYASATSRAPWADRFRTPDVDDLLAPHAGPMVELIESARKRLLELDGIQETIVWRGIPWRWTFEYQFHGSSGWASIIPEPDRPQIALPLPIDVIESLPMRRLKKAIRDGIIHGREVRRTRWCSWDITTMTQLDDIMDLVRRKHASGRA